MGGYVWYSAVSYWSAEIEYFLCAIKQLVPGCVLDVFCGAFVVQSPMMPRYDQAFDPLRLPTYPYMAPRNVTARCGSIGCCVCIEASVKRYCALRWTGVYESVRQTGAALCTICRQTS